jgi:hypothetical protein
MLTMLRITVQSMRIGYKALSYTLLETTASDDAWQ